MKYTANYCEENIWHLAGESGLLDGPRYVVLLTSPAKSTPVFKQKAAPGEDEPCFWDYHVIMAVKASQGSVIYDFDTTLPFPCPLERYVKESFFPGRKLPFNYQPRFRVVTADEYRKGFASDRSHMKRPDGTWRSPPPEWPLINPAPASLPLQKALDLRVPSPGELLDVEGLLKKLS